MSTTPDPGRPVRGVGRRPWLLASALLLTLVVVGAAVLLTGRGGGSDPATTPGSTTGPPTGRPSASSSPSVDLTRAVVAREPFCGRLTRAPIREALAGRVARLGSYAPGDRVELAPGLRDVADEFGCRYAAAAGARARVWIFAAPVRASRARRLAGDPGAGCRPLPTRTPFGRVSATSVCPSSDPRGRSVTLRGLFGDAWLTCRIADAAPQPSVVGRAERWCTTVVRSLAG